ncbi:MAG: hypothetical protein HY011_02825 [Acidobacteria bacterium]|nr:hypothetical protein [Acidobacteriota bacterium]
MKVSSRLFIHALAAVALCVFNLQAQTRTTSSGQARPTVRTNDPATYRYPWEHGYRAGYEDGYVKGKSDFNDASPRNAQSSEAYRRADRGYAERMGRLAEFQDAYQIGFELGYDDGYFGRGYTVAIPPNLGKVVAADVAASAETTPAPPTPAPSNRTRTADATPAPRQDDRRPASARDRIVVRDGVEMKVRLQTPISTKTNREGDQFTAVVLDPSEYADATVTGHIAKLNKSGKLSGKTELSLTFDSIEMPNGQRGRFAAQVERVYESEQVKTVDEEGNVETGSRTKDTAVRTGGGAVLGAILGGVIGGGKGAAIGAAVGAGAGAGSVIYQGSKDLQLDPGTEMLIRTAAPAQSRD